MSTLTCLHCGAGTNGVVLCTPCQHTARKALANLANYHADLFNLPAQSFGSTRSNKVSDPTGNSVAVMSAASPIEDAAAEAKTMLVTWVRALIDDRPQVYAPIDTVAALTHLLGQQMRTIATLGWAGDLLRDLLTHERKLRRVIEANKGKWYAGPCGKVLDEETGAYCTRVLYADPADSQVRCPVCRTTWPVTERRHILLNQARDKVTNVASIARACAVLLGDGTSQAKLERRIQNWVDRGKLERQDSLDLDGRVRKVYRVGDVLDLLNGDATRRAEGRSA